MKKKILTITILMLCLGLTFIITNPLSAKEMKAEEIIRLHVLANSDNEEDQELKLKVRDEIISNFNEGFSSETSREEAEKMILDNLADIEKLAQEKVYAEGYSYPVKAELGDFNFPIKAYNNSILPAGEYRALKVVIGQGAGANWWCVMFPPLCFVDLNHQVVEKKEQIQKKEVKIEVRFKVVELWQSVKTAIKTWF